MGDVAAMYDAVCDALAAAGELAGVAFHRARTIGAVGVLVDVEHPSPAYPDLGERTAAIGRLLIERISPADRADVAVWILNPHMMSVRLWSTPEALLDDLYDTGLLVGDRWCETAERVQDEWAFVRRDDAFCATVEALAATFVGDGAALARHARAVAAAIDGRPEPPRP